MLSGHVSGGYAARPGTFVWNEPNARKLSMPGTWSALSMRRCATSGWPMIVMRA